MKTRDVYLINGQTLKDSDTVTLSLTPNLKIQYLIVRYSNTAGAGGKSNGRLNDQISKLALVNGSTVLHSLSFKQEQAKNFFDNHRMPYQSLSQAAGAVITEEAIIDFRTKPGDQTHYLDTAQYTNAQLQFTHSFTISATDGFATGDGVLTVIARVIDSGAAAAAGFVMAKQLDSFASAASGDHDTDLPLDFPLAAVMVLDPVDGEGPDHYLSNFKLTADTDSFIPVDMAYADLLQRNVDDFGLAEQYCEQITGTTGTEKSDLYYAAKGIVADFAVADTTLAKAAGNEFAWTSTAGGIIGILARGSAPHSAAMYRFGDGVDPADIFDPTGVGKFQLKLTNAATGATPTVVTIQQHS